MRHAQAVGAGNGRRSLFPSRPASRLPVMSCSLVQVFLFHVSCSPTVPSPRNYRNFLLRYSGRNASGLLRHGMSCDIHLFFLRVSSKHVAQVPIYEYKAITNTCRARMRCPSSRNSLRRAFGPSLHLRAGIPLGAVPRRAAEPEALLLWLPSSLLRLASPRPLRRPSRARRGRLCIVLPDRSPRPSRPP